MVRETKTKTRYLLLLLGASLVTGQLALAASQTQPPADMSKQTQGSSGSKGGAKTESRKEGSQAAQLRRVDRFRIGPPVEARKLADKAASEALKTLPKLVTNQNVHSLGFDSLAQAKRARLGMPTGEYVVRLDELKMYDVSSDASRLFHRVERITYPIQADGTTRSAVEIVRAGEGWTVGTFGGASTMRALAEVRAATARRDGRDISSYFKATIPAFNLVFVAISRDDGVFLTPVADSPKYHLVKGQTLPAEQALNILSPAAKKHNGLPG